MDFVQRNLINERNNLQIELAKAKALIAELSEAYPHSEFNDSKEKRDNVPNNSYSEKEERSNVINDSHPTPVRTVTNNKQGVSSLAAKLKQQARDASFKKPMSEQAEYISDLENVIATIAESINVSAADLYETYRITPARRDLLDKIQSTAMRDAKDAMGPDGEDFRASSIKKSDGALSRISRIELMKMKGKPEDKRTHAQHPMHRFFPDDRSPNQLTDRALNADLAAERKREISNRPKKKKAN